MLRQRLPLLLAALLVPALLPGSAVAKTTETALANGLRVIVQEDHRAPVVMSQVWYRVGSVDEQAGHTGISHLLEHMMFKGTRDVPTGDFDRIVSRFGGEHNAFTTAGYTAYYQYLDRSRLPLAFALEADRMRQLIVDPAEYTKELEVVREERRMRVEDNPLSVAVEKFRAVALPGNPAGEPTIGWPEDLANITADDVRDWYDTWYAPNNAIVVVVGDVQPDDVFRLAGQYFGALKPRKLPHVLPPRTAPSPGLREMRLSVPAKVPTLLMAWNVPSLMTAPGKGEDAWALDVLAGVLDGGLSARFERELVRSRKVAAGASADYDMLARGDSLFTVSATPANGRQLADLEKAVREVIGKLRDAPPADDELARVKAQVVAELVYEQDSVSGQAQLIGSLAASGYDWRLKDTWADNLMKVTPADVQRVARTMLVDDSLTIARVLPANGEK